MRVTFTTTIPQFSCIAIKVGNIFIPLNYCVTFLKCFLCARARVWVCVRERLSACACVTCICLCVCVNGTVHILCLYFIYIHNIYYICTHTCVPHIYNYINTYKSVYIYTYKLYYYPHIIILLCIYTYTINRMRTCNNRIIK